MKMEKLPHARVAARWGARLDATVRVVPVAQRAEALGGACGSLVIALAVADGRVDGDEAWRLSQIDECHQAEKWGKDPEAEARLARVQGDILAAARLLALAQEN